MLKDLIKIFEKSYNEYRDKIILDRYELKPGLYIKIENNRKLNDQNIMIIKKRDKKVKNIYETQEDEYINKIELYKWFKEKDYYSSLLDNKTNKAIDQSTNEGTKAKIHSNNYLSCFFKRKTLPDKIKLDKKYNSKDEYFKKILNNYFEILVDPAKYRKDNDKTQELLNRIKDNYKDIINRTKINNCKDAILKIIPDILRLAKEHDIDDSDYIKIFFDATLEEYKKCYELYLIPRIFLKNDFNEIIHNNIFGLSYNNREMNQDKPFLKLKSMKCKVPYRITIEEALLLKSFFDWLNYQKEFSLYISDDFRFNQGLPSHVDLKVQACHYLHIHRDRKKGLVIDDYEFLPGFSQRINFNLQNVLMMEEGEDKNRHIIINRKINKLNELEKEVDNIFFNGKLKFNYYSDPKIEVGRLSKNMANLLMISKGAFHDYFWKGNSKNIRSIIDKISIEIIKEQIRNIKYAKNKLEYYSRFKKAAKAYNLRISLLNYFNLGGKEMSGKIKEMIGKMKNKISLDVYLDCDTDDEFYFISGQLAYYILSQSEKSNKDHDLVEPFLRAKDGERIKKELKYFYDRYKHAIPLNYRKFNNAFSMVLAYQCTNKEKSEDMFLAGFLAKNVFYEKKEQEDSINEN